MAGWYRGPRSRLSKIPILGWSSSSSSLTTHPLLKATAIVTLLALLLSVFQVLLSSRGGGSSGSSSVIPSWLSLSLRPSLILSGSYSPARSSSGENSTHQGGSAWPSSGPNVSSISHGDEPWPEFAAADDESKESDGGVSAPLLQKNFSPREQIVDEKREQGDIKGRHGKGDKQDSQVVAEADRSFRMEDTAVERIKDGGAANVTTDSPAPTEDRSTGAAAVGVPLDYANGSAPLVRDSPSTVEDTRGGKARPKITENELFDRRRRIEQDLLTAKLAIENASPEDRDPSLYHVIYRDGSKFSKSYKLMEEMFRVHVYREGDKRLVHKGPMQGIYCSEGKFIDTIERGSTTFNEPDPEKAHMYFLPYSVTEMTLKIYVQGSHSMAPLNNFVVNYVNEIAAKHPFWNRTHGADHFFVSCHDWGPATARDHPELRTNAMKVVCNADLREEYVLGKDASLPEIYLHKKKLKMGGPGPLRRNILAFFAGHMHGHVRPTLLDLWKDKEPDMKIYEMLPKEIERKMNYEQHMKHSKYCICAAGFEVNSPRIVESIYYECVPVIIADHFVHPFSDVLNWNTFSVTLPESEIPNLKSILTSITERQYSAMQRRLAKVRQHFIWNSDAPVKYDVFHMILHDVWMSRLNRLDSRLLEEPSAAT